MIFRPVGNGRPRPVHGYSAADRSRARPRPLRLTDIVATNEFLGGGASGDPLPDLVAHTRFSALEVGLHRATRQQRLEIHARVLPLDALSTGGNAS